MYTALALKPDKSSIACCRLHVGHSVCVILLLRGRRAPTQGGEVTSKRAPCRGVTQNVSRMKNMLTCSEVPTKKLGLLSNTTPKPCV